MDMDMLYMFGGMAGAITAVIVLGSWIAKGAKKAFSLLKPIGDELKGIESKIEMANAATRAQLKYSISRAYREYAQDGRIDRYALECVLDMYAHYKKLGGNSFIDEIMELLRALPVSSPTRT